MLGEFPPESAEWVIIPQDWFDKVSEPPPAVDAAAPVAFGLDTAGGKSENVLASVQGRVVRLEWASRDQHQTPRLVAAVRECAGRYSTPPVVAVDYVGLGGKGVGDDLAADGWSVLPFVGGGREFAGIVESSGLYADVATWAWFSLREAVRLTVQAIDAGRPERYIYLPRDPVLREQLARRFTAAGDRRYKMETKDPADSPDRGDAVAMAWLASVVAGNPGGRVVVSAEDVLPDLDQLGVGKIGAY